MKRKLIAVLFLSLLLLHFPLASQAWGTLGHRIVGEIADRHLTPKTRTAIRQILGNESIAMASNWADFIKSDSSYRYISSWHYINLEKGLSLAQFSEHLKKDTATDAYTRLNFLAAELKKKALPREKKVMYLKLLIHIAEDISQPLHVSPTGTTGGNDIKLNWFSQATNLHSVWDSYLIEHQQLSYTEYAAVLNYPTAAEKRKYMGQPLNEWLYDSYVIAQQLHDDITAPNPRLGYEYNYKYLATLNGQLLKGGLRLAGLLNSIFGK